GDGTTPIGTATVIVPRTATLPKGGIRIRSGPSTGSPYVAPQGRPGNDAFTGTTVTVYQVGIPASDGTGGEWWKVMPASGGPGGYARAVDPQGVSNFSAISFVNVPAAVSGWR